MKKLVIVIMVISKLSAQSNSISNDSANKYHNEGGMCASTGNHLLAIENYDKAINFQYEATKIDKSLLAWSFFQRGCSYEKIGMYSNAINDYRKAIEFDSKQSDAYLNISSCKYSLEDIYGAIDELDKLIVLFPTKASAYYNRGFCKEKQSNDQGAIKDYSKAIEISSNFTNAYLNRGNCKFRLGDKKGACLDWSKAGEKGSTIAYESIRKYCK